MAKKPKLGSGKRFAAIAKKVNKEPGYSAKDAAAVAASIGRKKYGAKKFAKLSKMGKKNKK